MRKQIEQLQKIMQAHGMSAYLVPSSDYHASEYLGDFFKARQFMSGFTGSAGTLVVSHTEAALFTDGRYFLQAEEELIGSGITLMRMDEPGVPTLEEYLAATLPSDGILGVDGRTLTAAAAKALLDACAQKNIRIVHTHDLVGQIWEDRPPFPAQKVFQLDIQYSGESAKNKLDALLSAMQKAQADAHLITTLDDIAWLFNFRGGDIAYNPVALAYAIIQTDGVFLFIDEAKLDARVSEELQALRVSILPYDAIYAHIRSYKKPMRLLLSSKKVNYTLYSLAALHTEIIDADNPTIYQKAIKNAVEQQNLRNAHIKDGIAMSKFLFWLKSCVSQGNISELTAGEKINSLRQEQQGCIGASFPPIAGYGAHGAIIHYRATEKTNALLAPSGLFLLDSGGQYFEGTTDVTRTVALGALTEQQKKHFTLVLKGMLRLAHARFPFGCAGYHIDALARIPLWSEGLDYKHGTGHGIGYMLCVHEPPVGIRWKRTERHDTAILEPGMMLSNEPGLYIAGEYGIRIENQMLVQKGPENEYGQFLQFEALTLVPIDLDAIAPDMLTQEERAWLNAYHARVYSAISPHLAQEERDWLKCATREI